MKLNYRIIRNYFSVTMVMAAVAAITGNVQASYPEGYYKNLEGKCGAELMTAVKSKVRNHTVINYGDNTWDAFRDTDVKTVNGVDYWWDMYSNELVKVGNSKPDNSIMNIEHSVANSWWGGTKNDAYKDIVHLNPSNSTANNRKGNYPLAELSSITWNNGVTFVGKPKSGQGGGASNAYEPADEYKGDFARVFMYMFTVYNDIAWESKTNWMYDTSSKLMFKQWAQDLLLKWSAQDPVSEKEKNRNDGIYKNQKNRNPFIDLPHLADHIWGSKSNEPFYIDEVDTPDVPKDPNTESEEFDWLNGNDATQGDWVFDHVQLPGSSSYIWSWKEYNGSHYLNASAFVNNTNYASLGYAWSPSVSFENITKATVTFSHAAKFQTTLKSLCKFVVKDKSTGEIFEEAIPNWPAAGNWNFSGSGSIDLTKYAGRKNVQVGFKYASTTSGADTWEIRDVKLLLDRSTSGIEIPSYEDTDDSFLVEVWGNNILVPEGARIFDINGREFDGRNLQKGVYIVVKPTFKKAVKVMING